MKNILNIVSYVKYDRAAKYCVRVTTNVPVPPYLKVRFHLALSTVTTTVFDMQGGWCYICLLDYNLIPVTLRVKWDRRTGRFIMPRAAYRAAPIYWETMHASRFDDKNRLGNLGFGDYRTTT